MRRGWVVKYENGTVIKEKDMEWRRIPKTGIVKLSLLFDGKRWDIHDKPAYVQKKRASVVPGVIDSFRVESRSIGYYEGNKKVWYTVDEFTGQMKMEVQKI